MGLFKPRARCFSCNKKLAKDHVTVLKFEYTDDNGIPSVGECLLCDTCGDAVEKVASTSKEEE